MAGRFEEYKVIHNNYKDLNIFLKSRLNFDWYNKNESNVVKYHDLVG